jgi:DNA-binding GntR family transcriptional regulator
MRLLLECPAAARAARQGLDARVLAGLAADAELPDRLAGDGYAGYAAFTAQDALFHEQVAAAAGNSLLHAAIGRLHAHLHLHRLHFPTSHFGTSSAEHRAVVTAIAAGDAAAAAAAMRWHLETARDRHRNAFDS